MNLKAIFMDNAAKRAENEAEEARREAARQEAMRKWKAECEKLRPALLSQAAAKAEAWLRANLIRPEEFIRLQEASNGLILHIKMEDERDEMREWEIEFLFFFKGQTPNDLKVEWARVDEDREFMESYYECDY